MKTEWPNKRTTPERRVMLQKLFREGFLYVGQPYGGFDLTLFNMQTHERVNIEKGSAYDYFYSGSRRKTRDAHQLASFREDPKQDVRGSKRRRDGRDSGQSPRNDDGAGTGPVTGKSVDGQLVGC